MRIQLITTALIVVNVCSAHSAQIPVAAHTLERGSIISDSDLDVLDEPANSHRIGLADHTSLVGKELKRTIASGQPIYSTDIKTPDLVKRDELVTMLVARGGMTIAATGKALENGSKGAHIRVQNVASKQIVEGEIASPGTVLVSPLVAPQIPAGY